MRVATKGCGCCRRKWALHATINGSSFTRSTLLRREELLELLEYQGQVARAAGKAPAHMDAFGDGEALASVQAKAQAARLALAFHPKRDHLDPSLADYQARAAPATAVLSSDSANGVRALDTAYSILNPQALKVPWCVGGCMDANFE